MKTDDQVYEQEKELVKEFLKSKRVSLSYVVKKTNIPFGTLAYYSSDLARVDKANKITISALYEFIRSMGVSNKEDINKIVRKEEYIVNENK